MALADAKSFRSSRRLPEAEARQRHLLTTSFRSPRSPRSRCRASSRRWTPKVYRELREIADYIESMQQEIGALQVNDLKNSRIPAAGEELGAIVQATEAATNTIMECAETVMAARLRAIPRVQGAGRREDAGHLRGLLVPGHHRPAHRQGGRDAAAHRGARVALRRRGAGEGHRRLPHRERARARRAQGEVPAARPAARRRGRRPVRRGRQDVCS